VADPSHETDLVPILVDGSGRDGTTLAMQLLGTSPEIAFDRVYPYEQRYFNYLLQWSRLPERADWNESKWNLDSLAHSDFLRDTDVVGPIPWMERSLIANSGSQDFWKAIFEAAWTEFSGRAREAMQSQLGDTALSIRYYAQKNAESWDMPADEVPLPEVKIIALLRDPRDIWQSSVAFHRRRRGEGDAFLPLAEGESEESYLVDFIERQKTRLAWLQALPAENEVPIVRYENLIADLPAEAERLGDWLGVQLDAGAVLRRRDGLGEHITATSPEASVGRWKNEMSGELAARFSAAMGPQLAEAGYEI
jgi:hypothetical protein